MKIFGKPLELVVFDVDGVLLDLHLVFQKNLEDTASILGLPLEPIGAFLHQAADGTNPGKRGLFGSMYEFWNGHDLDTTKFAKVFKDVEHANPIPAFSYTHSVLAWLRERDILIALCTNNSQEGLDWKLATANIVSEQFVSTATSSLGFHKPDPRMLEHVINQAGISKEKVVFVGDWHADILTARATDVEFVGTLSGSLRKNVFLDTYDLTEDHVIDSIADLPKLIES